MMLKAIMIDQKKSTEYLTPGFKRLKTPLSENHFSGRTTPDDEEDEEGTTFFAPAAPDSAPFFFSSLGEMVLCFISCCISRVAARWLSRLTLLCQKKAGKLAGVFLGSSFSEPASDLLIKINTFAGRKIHKD